VDCIEELGCLLEEHGLLAVFEPRRSVPRLARWVGAQDSVSAAAALAAMQKIFALCDSPQRFWTLAGSISDKQRAILDGRFKHDKAAAGKLLASKRARNGAAAPAATTTTTADAPPSAQVACAAPPAASEASAPATARHVGGGQALSEMDFFDLLQSPELEQRVTGHKLFLARMQKQPQSLVPVASDLVKLVTKMMTLAFRRESESVEFFFRNCKYPTNSLMEMINTRPIAEVGAPPPIIFHDKNQGSD
jgi:hypothetical protein